MAYTYSQGLLLPNLRYSAIQATPVIPIEDDSPIDVQHPELHHYTNWGGLSDILTSGALYGTRYDRLNDRTEVEHLRQFLKDSLRDRFRQFLLIRKKTGGLKISLEMRKNGGVLHYSKVLAEAFVDTLYKNVI